MRILMTTRSSRLFVVLLHLVGVSTHLPSSLQLSGIVGVNPFSIVLESSDPQVLLDDSAYLQPHWLQDTLDQTCLHPMGGFSDCGDATLWLVIPKQRRHARRTRWIKWAMEEDHADDTQPQGYAIQLVVDDNNRQSSSANGGSSSSSIRRQNEQQQEDFSKKECLTRRKKDNKLVIASCSEDRAWSWHFNQHGILHFEQPRNYIIQSMDKRLKKKSRQQQQGLECLWRDDKEAILGSCSGEAEEVTLSSDRDERVVQIALIRQATAVATDSIQDDADDEPKAETSSRTKEEATTSKSDGLPSRKDIAHSHAATTSTTYHARTELNPTARRTSLSPQKRSTTADKKQSSSSPPLHFLKDTNPILLANKRELASSSTPLSGGESSSLRHETSSSVGGTGSANNKPVVRKIQRNPYIEESKDERWTDPQTGLVYRTDLCQYLGHDRKEVGRHTITGVGQFMKTVFNIKVYGVAHYVSKRDILADPMMEKFASSSSEELRENTDFYQVLRKMASPGESNSITGKFDRTLFIKTNMQLSTETMRQSLDADWKFMTEDAKALLIGSSMKSKPASSMMLEAIQSADNPNSCSCSQIPPEGIEYDPDCCARGTELVFTWRKNGDLEIRLNGDFIDSFPRPDIAEAIFFEYFRLDDPMSTDVLDHVVDGFPFLLAPLAQVKGVKTPVVQHTQSASKSTASTNPVVKAVFGFGDAVSGHAHNFAEMVHSGANEVTERAANTARSVGDVARKAGEEMDRRREMVGERVSALAQQALSAFDGGRSKALVILPAGAGSARVLDNFSDFSVNDTSSSAPPRSKTLRDAMMSRFYRDQIPPTAPDEIFPMIHPTKESAQRFFIGLVHLYLLLMLIVSFPAQLSTRTKLVIRKSGNHAVWDSDDSDSTEHDSRDSREVLPVKHLARPKKKNGTRAINAFRSPIFR